MMDDKNIIANTENYDYLLDFISFVFMRNKYKSDEGVEQINEVSQPFAS